MNPQEFTPEQKADIEERVGKAKLYLEQLQLQPGCIVQAINQGNDVFGLKPIAYLQDLKYTSPVQKKDLK